MTSPTPVLDITQNENTAGRAGDKLKGRVAFVTGGTRGIGAAICRSLASQGALRHMAERGSGRIVNVSPVIGEMRNIGQANYAASKSGLFALTKTLAREAAFLLARSEKITDPKGVGLTVNTITPGFIATE